jgi:2-amino-4-hydroxy-6-hydroxymethyldihydropteridine diphosphokinase
MKYYLSLGSNLGEREENIERALSLLTEEGVEIVRASSLYETQPVDFPSQPWFINQVVKIDAGIEPQDLLILIKGIEKALGRKTMSPKGPRMIDIDILLAEERVIRTRELRVPHPRLDKRNFVLIPFAEIAPEAVHPLLNESIQNLLQKSNDHSAVKQVKKSQKKKL